MNIGVLSGKGGTGKTTVSTNLAVLMNANYIDCDVEEPNGFIFLNPQNVSSKEVQVDLPVIDKEKCTLCGKCVEACQFKALAKVRDDILVFEKLCHSCGACEIACEYGALSYEKRSTGVIEEGKHGDMICKRGVLNIGEPMAVPVIKELLSDVKEGTNILDFSPGTSCNVVNSLDHADAVILVTEPTKFGLHDLNIAVNLVRNLNIPFGIVINKHIPSETIIHEYCENENIKILGEVTYSREAAEAYSKGLMLIDLDKYNKIFNNIVSTVKEELLWNL